MVNDLLYNLLEASHKRRVFLRMVWMQGLIGKDEYDVRCARLYRWTEYRINKLRSYVNG